MDAKKKVHESISPTSLSTKKKYIQKNKPLQKSFWKIVPKNLVTKITKGGCPQTFKKYLQKMFLKKLDKKNEQKLEKIR